MAKKDTTKNKKIKSDDVPRLFRHWGDEMRKKLSKRKEKSVRKE
jgi:hypothetical protein